VAIIPVTKKNRVQHSSSAKPSLTNNNYAMTSEIVS